MRTVANKPRTKRMPTRPEDGVHEVPGNPNLVQEGGHILLKSLDVNDWQQALHDERESRLASLDDVNGS